jgi:hypothetical protein
MNHARTANSDSEPSNLRSIWRNSTELLELGAAGIHVTEYLTVLPPPEVLRAKLHDAIETAWTRIQGREEDPVPELPAEDRS